MSYKTKVKKRSGALVTVHQAVMTKVADAFWKKEYYEVLVIEDATNSTQIKLIVCGKSKMKVQKMFKLTNMSHWTNRKVN